VNKSANKKHIKLINYSNSTIDVFMKEQFE